MIRTIHLTSGLILFFFVTTHLVNHSLGLVSLKTLEWGGGWFYWFWRVSPAGHIFYAALTAHILLAFWSLYKRRSLRMRPIDWVQLILGILIPLQLIAHVVHTRAAYELFGQIDTYTLELVVFFILVPDLIYKQMIMLLVVWGHGLIGMHQWLKYKSFYARIQPVAIIVAIALPAAALAGVWTAGRDIMHLAETDGWVQKVLARNRRVDQSELDYLVQIETYAFFTVAGLLAITLAARPIRQMLRNYMGLVQLTYPDGKRINLQKGASVLEASRLHGIPHASACGGRGRCSTCRIRVSEGLDELAPPGSEEDMVLRRIGAPENVRLACQTRPMSSLVVHPLLTEDASAPADGTEASYTHGQEQEIVVLFADLRGFTALSENKYPYDVVFLLNRYFAAIGPAITDAGGYVDKFIGDGVMALFGLETDLDEASRQAVQAVKNISKELDQLNKHLEQELSEPLKLGIGLHGGTAIVGKMGYAEANNLTAVGDTVNTASRLEAACKAHGVQLVMSDDVSKRAGIPDGQFETREIEVRGRQSSLTVVLVPEASSL